MYMCPKIEHVACTDGFENTTYFVKILITCRYIVEITVFYKYEC